jgi:hypothetical protein
VLRRPCCPFDMRGKNSLEERCGGHTDAVKRRGILTAWKFGMSGVLHTNPKRKRGPRLIKVHGGHPRLRFGLVCGLLF